MDEAIRTAAERDLPETTVKNVLWKILFDDTTPHEWLDTTASDESVHDTTMKLVEEHLRRVDAYKDADEHVINAFIGDIKDKHPSRDVDELIATATKTLDEL